MGKSTNYVELRPGLIMQHGEWAFITGDTTVEVPTKMVTVTTALATPEAYSGSATAGGEVMFSDKTLTSGQVTFARKVAVDSGLKFSYEMIGTYGATPGMVSAV